MRLINVFLSILLSTYRKITEIFIFFIHFSDVSRDEICDRLKSRLQNYGYLEK